ncbi:hypothetical protein QTP86_014072, partial [Hemibagrus guttatus]
KMEIPPWPTGITQDITLNLSNVEQGINAGYTLDGVPTHRRAHTHSHSLTQSHTTDNLEMPINLPCMSLDWGRKPPRHGENKQTPHTRQRWESNPQPWRCEANVLTTKPPCPPGQK